MDRALIEDYLRELHHGSLEIIAESRLMGSRARPSSASPQACSGELELVVTRLLDAPRELAHGSDGLA